MACNEKLAERVRNALAKIPNVKEKKMFRGITFMVDDKMCVSVSGEELMCRIDPKLHDELTEKIGCRKMIKGGKPIIGFIYVAPEIIKLKKEFDFWINICLDFNDQAKSSRKKNK